jgi:hypothetical protein
VCNTNAPFPRTGRCGTLPRMLVRISARLVVDHREPGRCGGRSGGWAAVLPWLRAAAVALGVRARARGPDARWRACVATAAGAVRLLRDHARAAGCLLGPAPARWRGGDRRGAVGQSRRGRAPQDRRATRALTVDGPWVAARSHTPGRDPVRSRIAVGAGAGPSARAPAKPAGSPLADAVEAIGSAVRGVPAAVRDPRRAVGARGRAHRRAVVRLLTRPRGPTRPLVAIKRQGCRAGTSG